MAAGDDSELLPESTPQGAVTGLSTVMLEGEGGPHKLLRRPVLSVLEGTDAGAVFVADSKGLTIGSQEGAHVRLRDPTVSRFHSEVSLVDGEVHVRDLGSRNGTRVDGVSILHARLRPGPIIQVGLTTLRVDLGHDALRVPLSAQASFGSHGR